MESSKGSAREASASTERPFADSTPNAAKHTPVLLERCLALLAPALTGEQALVIDATLGLGGHSEALLQRFPNLTLIGIDRDERALAASSQRLQPFAERIHLVHAEYDEIPTVLSDLGFAGEDFAGVAGILFDLGVSSMQLDEADRGFSYQADADLDMRMDRSGTLTAAEVVNEYSQADLSRVIREYGEERFAGRIAAAIVAARAQAPIRSTAALADVVREAIPAATRRTGGHPAKRTFQAIRIEVNGELEILENAIPAALASVKVGGRVVVMSYQSLEDRIVKRAFAAACANRGPIDLPVVIESDQPEFSSLTRGAELAGEAEVASNRRAKPVRLRAVERLRVAA